MITDNDIHFMRTAIELAAESITSGQGGPFGAIIVKNNQIISKGKNEVTILNDPTAHAEIQAIRAACKQLNDFTLSDCVIYTSCEPCPMCLSAIYWANINKIYFAATRKDAANINFIDDFIYQEIDKPIVQRKLSSAGLLQNEAVAVMQAWSQLENKIMY